MTRGVGKLMASRNYLQPYGCVCAVRSKRPWLSHRANKDLLVEAKKFLGKGTSVYYSGQCAVLEQSEGMTILD